jgi:hypothetical protein
MATVPTLVFAKMPLNASRSFSSIELRNVLTLQGKPVIDF